MQGIYSLNDFTLNIFNAKDDFNMNNLIKPFLDEHVEKFEFSGNEAEKFEHLVNYISMRDYSSRNFDPHDTFLGRNEIGLDGIGIFVNGMLVANFQEIESFFNDEKGNKHTDISVSFVFTQAKTTEKFELTELTLFLSTVQDFIQGGNINASNERFSELQKIFKYIQDNPTHLSKNPDCHIIYAYTGKIADDVMSIASNAFATVRAAIEYKGFFDEIKFSIYDSEKITNACRSIKRSIKKTVPIKNYSTLPPITGVIESFIGAVKCEDYVKLITNDDDLLLTHLFEDNVRYYQGRNKVNSEMYGTIADAQKQQAFALLNNGITVIAKEIRRTGDNFILDDFQIVNGCQTSFVLYENRKRLNDDSYVTVKLISSTDKNVVDSIVKTTNSQTPIVDEAFETLSDFHKDLETVYKSYDKDYRLFYERRSKQYDSENVNQNRVISFPVQTAAYVAMFLGQPQSTHRYFGDLLKANKAKIYQEDDVKEQYCIASMYVFFVDKFLRDNHYSREYRLLYKFHIALLCRALMQTGNNPKANSNEMKRLCQRLYENLKNRTDFEKSIKKAISVIDEVIEEYTEQVIHGNHVSRTADFTGKILKKLNVDIGDVVGDRGVLPLKAGNHFKCRVTGWGKSFAYVDIIEHKEMGSIHISQIDTNYVHDIGDKLSRGQIVDAKIIEDEPNIRYGFEMSMK